MKRLFICLGLSLGLAFAIAYFTSEGAAPSPPTTSPFAFKTQDSLQEAVEQGNPQAQFEMGLHADEGSLFTQDTAVAAQWYAKAATQGHAGAAYALGMIYVQGKGGVPIDLPQGIQWLTQAAERGHPEAQYTLGWAYESGKGVPQDGAKALEWHQKAASSGLPDAQFHLGELYEEGTKCPRDPVEAAIFYTLAVQGYDRSKAEHAFATKRTALKRLSLLQGTMSEGSISAVNERVTSFNLTNGNYVK